MVTVPIYQRDVSARPIFQQDLAAQATPQAFGADIGRGLQSVARGLDQAALAVAQMQELEAATRAKEADNALADWDREAKYGPNGFLMLEGKNAVEARAKYEEEFQKKRTELSKGLNPMALRAYEAASDARRKGSFDDAIRHTGKEFKSWVKSASSARSATFANDALVGFTNPQTVEKNIAAGILEMRQAAELQGLDADTQRVNELEYRSEIRRNITLRIAKDDPVAANEYLKSHKDQITGVHAGQIEEALASGLIEAEAVRATDEILSKGRKVSDLPGDIVGEVIGETETVDKKGPTRVRAFLMGKTPGKGPEAVNGLDDAFATNLAAMMQDAPPGIRDGLQIGSGYRSVERQRQLWEASDKTGKMVAPPGRSYHNKGQAVDLWYNGTRLDKAPKEVRDWVHDNASKYGMYFPMGYEPWHIEPHGTRDGTIAPKTNKTVPRVSMPSYDDIEAGLDGISDPKVRELVRRRINSQIEATNKAVEMREKAARAELWKMIDQGATPDQVPEEVRQDAGLAAVSSAWEYTEKQAKRSETVNDETLMYDMRKYAAMEPEKFAEIDLNDYRDRLSKEAIKELTGLQTGALTDQRKAREDGLNLTAAFSQSQTQLEAVGITTAGKEGEERAEAARRLAQFQNQLAGQMDEFKRSNDGRPPTQTDVQQMINRLLLPVIVKTPKTSVWGMTARELWGVDEAVSETPGLAFEMGGLSNMADGSTVEVAVQYKDIPPRDRVEIEVALETQMGRKPSEAEVEGAYRRFLAEAK